MGGTAIAISRLRFGSMPPEIRLTLLLFLASFFVAGMPRVYTQNAAHTLFIELYGAAALPWAYLAEALCVPVAGYLYVRAERALGLRALLVGTLSAQILMLLLLRAGIAFKLPLVAGVSVVYFEIEFVLSSLMLWGLANQLMTLRQGKRLFGFISAGEPVAIILCGLSTPLLLRWIGSADLFYLSALGAAVGIVLVLHILRHYEPVAAGNEAAEKEIEASGAPWWKSRYFGIMIALVAVGQMGYFFIDNAFYVEAGKHFPRAEELASFLGIYSAIMGGVSLLSSIVLAPWILRRFGVRGGLLTLPALLVLGALVVVIAAALGAPEGVLFYLVVANKIIDQSFRYTVDKTTFVTLFQPLPARQRTRVQASLESFVEPVAGGAAGLLLFGLINVMGFGATSITAVVLAACCIWSGVALVQYRAYLGALRTALARRAANFAQLNLDDAQSQALLHRGLGSERPAEVLYCLAALTDGDGVMDVEESRHLLRHASGAVRLEIARRIESGKARVDVSVLRAAAQVESDAQAKGAMIEALSAQGMDLIPEVARYLDSAQEQERLGASVGLIRHCGVEGVLAAGPGLLRDLRSSDPDRRKFAALVMERAGSANFYRPLLDLLRDPDPSVARAALRASGAVMAPKLWPAMIQALETAELRAAAMAALAAVGDPILPALDNFGAASDSPVLSHAIVSVQGRIATRNADERLYSKLERSRRSVRTRALRALWYRRYRASRDRFPLLREILHDEVSIAAGALSAWASIGGVSGDELALLRRVLEDEVARCIQNCFAVFGMMHDTVDMHEAYIS